MPYSRLRYHLVWSTKKREPSIVSAIEGVAYDAIRRESARIGTHVFEIGGVEDHVHVVVAIPPTLAVSHVVSRLKSSSASAVNRANLVCKDFKWQRGYAALTLRSNAFNDVCIYVRNQKRHHARRMIDEELEHMEEE